MLYFSIHEGQDVFCAERSDEQVQRFYKKVLFPLLTMSKKLAPFKRSDGKSGRQDTSSDTILTNGASNQLRSAATDGAFRALKAFLIILDEFSAPIYQPDAEGSKHGLAWNARSSSAPR